MKTTEAQKVGMIKSLIHNYNQSLNGVLNSKLSFRAKFKKLDLILSKYKKLANLINLNQIKTSELHNTLHIYHVNFQCQL